MKIKLSKSQWQQIGKTTGWIKTSHQEKMMPGQTPYTDEEKALLNGMVSDAAKGDPEEQGEQEDDLKDDLVNRRRVIRLHFSDGDHLVTDIQGTKLEVAKYYFPFGARKTDYNTYEGKGLDADYNLAQPDKARHPTKVEFIK